jgi:tetratricopeptide (TPR) repeat protein
VKPPRRGVGGIGGGLPIVLILILVCSAACTRKPELPESHPAQGAPAVVPPPPQRPVPAELRGAHDEIRGLQKAGQFQDALARYPALIGSLEKAWGAESPHLAPYAHDYALALRLAGKGREALAVAARTLERWPDSFQLRVLDATIRVEMAVARGGFDAAADAALRAVLAPESLPRLRGLRVDPASLLGEWAEMLLRAGRVEDALSVAERALALAPADFHARDVKARALLHRKQPLEAIAILQRLAAERPSPVASLQLAEALLDAGEPERAWVLFAKVLAGPRDAAEGGRVSNARLAVRGARALNQLRRHAEAAELLLGDLLEDCDYVEGLTELAAAARGLGAAAAARGLEGRVRRLERRERLVQAAAGARAAGVPSSIPYYQAEAALEVGRVGEALTLLEAAVRLGPKVARFHLELARVHLLLGRPDLAEWRLREGLGQGPSAVLFAELARVLALRGSPGEARSLLGGREPEEGPEESPVVAAGDVALSRGLRARAFLELGDREAAGAALRSEGDSEEANDVALLARAELAILEGRAEEAMEILQGSFDNVPGGHLPGSLSWAAALLALLPPEKDATADTGLPEDPSDFLDCPRLLRAQYPWERRGPAGAAEGWLERTRSALARRGEILAKMEGFGDSDVAARWRELLALYEEIGAERKAREVAWYVVALRPESVEDRRVLAATLDGPGEALVRLRVLEAALRLAPADQGLGELRRAARASLGLEAKPPSSPSLGRPRQGPLEPEKAE